MHPYQMPDAIKARILRRQGRPIAHETIDPARSALVVVDMQNYFVSERFASSVAMARTIAGPINRMAQAMRAVGAPVIWVQTTASGALEEWGNHHRHMLSAARVESRLAGLAEGSEGFALYGELDVQPKDLRATKIKYSALTPRPDGSRSELDQLLRANALETLLIAGTATNVCCESTARDAMLADYRVVMLSDGNAAASDEEHAASLNACASFFGDVMTVDEAVARLAVSPARRTAAGR